MAPRSKHNGLVPAVAYYRMSSDKQEASIPEQREAVQAYAKAHGYRIVREYKRVNWILLFPTAELMLFF